MKKIKTSKIVALAVTLMLIVNMFAGLSLTSFAASSFSVDMYVMDESSNVVTTVTPGNTYTAVVNLQGYTVDVAASTPIASLQVDVAIDPSVSVGYVSTKENVLSPPF